jgi:hypothetical protein
MCTPTLLTLSPARQCSGAISRPPSIAVGKTSVFVNSIHQSDLQTRQRLLEHGDSFIAYLSAKQEHLFGFSFLSDESAPRR